MRALTGAKAAGAGLALLTILSACGLRTAQPSYALPPAGAFMKGMTEAGYTATVFNSPTMAPALAQLHKDGVDWLSIQLGWYQNTDDSDKIFSDAKETPTDQSLDHLIHLAHRMGMRVFLDPFVNANQGNAWQAVFHPKSVPAWFHSYDRYLTHYARLAQAQHVDLLAIGDEFDSLDDVPANTPYWDHAIALVRRAYHGPVTYGADYVHYQKVTFWNQLNDVGMDAYFPLSQGQTPTVASLEANWTLQTNKIQQWRQASGLTAKPFIITELGYYSGVGAAVNPGTWSPSAPVDLSVQSQLYQATFATVYREPWLSGLFWFWWANPSNPHWQGGPHDNGYTLRGKPAEKVLRQHFTAKRQPLAVS